MTSTPHSFSRPEPPLTDTLALMMPRAPIALLLQAALLDADAAEQAWTRWRQITDDPKAFLASDRVGIKRHLPLLYHNLSKHSIDIGRDLEPYFRTARAREELRDQRFRRFLEQAVSALNADAIAFVIGKGVTVGLTIHDDPILRHSHDIDLLVRTEDLTAAGHTLHNAGFEPSVKSAAGDELRFDHESGLPVELHDRLYRTPFYSGEINHIWREARAGWLCDMPVKFLDDVTLLVQTPVHASVVPQRYGLSWMVDVVSLLKRGRNIHWPAVLQLAREQQVALPLYATYRYLVETFEAPIPSQVLDELRAQAHGVDKLRRLAVLDGLRMGPNPRIKPLWVASGWSSRWAMGAAMLFPPASYLKARHGGRAVGPMRLALLYAGRVCGFFCNQLNKACYRLRQRCFGTSTQRALRNRSAFEARLTPEERLLLGCLRQELSSQEADELAVALDGSMIDWPLVEHNAREQGVAPLLFTNLRRCQNAGLAVPADALNRLRGAMFRAIKTKDDHSRWLAHVLSYVNSCNLDVMMVKGAALDVEVLKTPWQVVSLDIDLLIRKHHSKLPDEICESIWDFNSQGPLECDFGTHHDLSIDELLPINYPRMWTDARRVDIDGRGVWIMSREDMLITACTDACRKRFFHLKNLFNLRAILEQFGDDLDWPRAARIAREQRCMGIVYAALVVARLAVRVDLDDAALRLFRPNVLRAAVIRALARRRSFTPVTRRSIVNQKDFTLGTKRILAAGNLSILLPYTAYTLGQVWRRRRWLAQKPEQSKPGLYDKKHTMRASRTIEIHSEATSPKAHGS